MDAGQRENRDAEVQVDDIVHTAYDSAGLARPSTAYEAGLAREIELENFSTNPIADAEALVFPDAQKQGGCAYRERMLRTLLLWEHASLCLSVLVLNGLYAWSIFIYNGRHDISLCPCWLSRPEVVAEQGLAFRDYLRELLFKAKGEVSREVLPGRQAWPARLCCSHALNLRRKMMSGLCLVSTPCLNCEEGSVITETLAALCRWLGQAAAHAGIVGAGVDVCGFVPLHSGDIGAQSFCWRRKGDLIFGRQRWRERRTALWRHRVQARPTAQRTCDTLL